jgi:hypothetical protein
MSYSVTARRPNISRHLTSLKAGGAMVRDNMIILPRGASDSMRSDAEYVCGKDDRYDWKHEEDAA